MPTARPSVSMSFLRSHLTLTRVIVLLGAALGLLALHAHPASATTPTANTAPQTTAPIANPALDQKRVCVYDANSIAGLNTFAELVHRESVDCALVYTGSPDWAGWVNPWFLAYNTGDLAFANWVRQSPANDRRQLIISQPLLPTGVVTSDPNWRVDGANGAFDSYDVQFAQNLVANGVGDAVIRLDWEANGDWGYDNIGSTAQDFANWAAFWRNTVEAMRSVPGAHFRFDWTINNGYRNIPYTSYYPGDDVVDIIGDDVYDSGVQPTVTDRWSRISGQGGGLNQLLAFAQAHGKPISIPEWGVGPTDQSLAGGDDPSYVANLAHVIATSDTAYECYFFKYGWATQLQTGPLSLAAYRAAFGDGGYATGTDDGLGIQAGSSVPAPIPTTTSASGTTHTVLAPPNTSAAPNHTTTAGRARTKGANSPSKKTGSPSKAPTTALNRRRKTSHHSTKPARKVQKRPRAQAASLHARQPGRRAAVRRR
jgi:hypothetical protein